MSLRDYVISYYFNLRDTARYVPHYYNYMNKGLCARLLLPIVFDVIHNIICCYILRILTWMQWISLFTERTVTKACFFNVDSRYRRGAAKFGVEDIDTNLCMHVIYGYAALRGLRIEMSDKGVLSS